MADNDTTQTAAPKKNGPAKKAYYHLYTSEDGKYQRGLHLFTSKPAPKGMIKMPGFPKVEMAICLYPHHPSNNFKIEGGQQVMRDGKPVFIVTHYGKDYEVIEGDPVIYEAPGQEDGAAMDHDRLDEEGADL